MGYVTSGTSVPFSHFYGLGITAVPSDEHDMRPIGLALIDSDIRYRADRPVVLEIEDARGKTVAAELVERLEADDTVCMIEVMKLFNSIRAGVAGTIVKISVENAQMVEFNQVLIHVKPD